MYWSISSGLAPGSILVSPVRVASESVLLFGLRREYGWYCLQVVTAASSNTCAASTRVLMVPASSTMPAMIGTLATMSKKKKEKTNVVSRPEWMDLRASLLNDHLFRLWEGFESMQWETFRRRKIGRVTGNGLERTCLGRSSEQPWIDENQSQERWIRVDSKLLSMQTDWSLVTHSNVA